MKRSFIVVFAGLLLGLGPAGIDSYAAIVTTIAKGYSLTAIDLQLGISAFVMAMGIGQIIIGPISDRFGRSKPLYFGMFIYVIGSVICVIAPNITVLIIGRILQGFGASCGQIISRAIMRDLYTGRDLAKITSDTTAVMATTVLLAPLVAYIVAVSYAWQGVFVILTVYAFILLLISKFLYQETLDMKNRINLTPSEILNAIKTIFLHPQSRAFVLVLVIGGLSMFSYVVSAPHVYELSFQTTGFKFAILYSIIGLGVIIGQFVNRFLINIIGTLSSIVLTLSIACFAVSIGIICTLTQQINEYGFAIVIFIFALSFMMMVANATALVMDPHGKVAGFAASLVGSLTFVLGSIGGTIVAWLAKGSATVVLTSMLIWLVVILLISVHWMWTTRYRYTHILG